MFNYLKINSYNYSSVYPAYCPENQSTPIPSLTQTADGKEDMRTSGTSPQVAYVSSPVQPSVDDQLQNNSTDVVVTDSVIGNTHKEGEAANMMAPHNISNVGSTSVHTELEDVQPIIQENDVKDDDNDNEKDGSIGSEEEMFTHISDKLSNSTDTYTSTVCSSDEEYEEQSENDADSTDDNEQTSSPIKDKNERYLGESTESEQGKKGMESSDDVQSQEQQEGKNALKGGEVITETSNAQNLTEDNNGKGVLNKVGSTEKDLDMHSTQVPSNSNNQSQEVMIVREEENKEGVQTTDEIVEIHQSVDGNMDCQTQQSDIPANNPPESCKQESKKGVGNRRKKDNPFRKTYPKRVTRSKPLS